MASNALKAEADGRAALMMGGPIPNNVRYLAVPVTDCAKKSCVVLTAPTVTSVGSKPKKRDSLRQKQSRLLKEEPLCQKLFTAKVLINRLQKRVEVCNGSLKRPHASSPINSSSYSEVISCSSKALNTPTHSQSYSTSPESDMDCKPHRSEDAYSSKCSGTSRREKKNKFQNGNLIEQIAKTSRSHSFKLNAKPIKRLSKVSNRHSIITNVEHVNELPEVATSQPSGLMVSYIDLAKLNICSHETTSPNNSHISSVVDVPNLSSPKAAAVANCSLESSVEIIEMQPDVALQNLATSSKSNDAPNPSSATVPIVCHTKKNRSINSSTAFQNFKKTFPKFASAIENFERFLQNSVCNVNGVAFSTPMNIFSVVSFFVHKTGVTIDFDWEFVLLNLDKIISYYITLHSQKKSIKTIKQHLTNALRRLCSYLCQLDSTQMPFHSSFSEDSFNDIVLNAVPQIPDNYAQTKLPARRQALGKQMSVLPCPFTDNTHVEGKRHSPLPKQEVIEGDSSLPLSDIVDQGMIKKESTLPRSHNDNQETIDDDPTPQCFDSGDEIIVKEEPILLGSVIGDQEMTDKESTLPHSNAECGPAENATVPSNDVGNNPTVEVKRLKSLPFIYANGKHNNKKAIMKFKNKFPTFINRLEEYRIYLQNDLVMNGNSVGPRPTSIFTLVSSFVQETSVTEDFDWKFVYLNIHKIVFNYLSKSSEVGVNTKKNHLKAFLKLGSYLHHLQVSNKSNLLPFFSFDAYNDILLNALKRLTNSRAKAQASKSPNLSSTTLKDRSFNLHKMGKLLVSDYVVETLDGVLAHGIAMEPFASRVYLIGMAPIPDSITPLEPSRETACRVQSVLMFIACLRNGCRSSKLCSLTLNDFAEPTWIDNHSALFRSRAREVAHSHPSYIWWTAAELRVVQYYVRHYRQQICSCTDGSSPLFPSPSRSTNPVGLVTKSSEVRSMFETVLRQVGTNLDVSSLSSHQLRNAYFSEMQQSGFTKDQMADLAWSLGHVEAYSLSSCKIYILRKVVRRSIACVERVLTRQLDRQQSRMHSRPSAKESGSFISIFNKMFPSLCKKNNLIASQQLVLAYLKLPFSSMPCDEQLFLTKSEMQKIKSSHSEKMQGCASHHENCKNKRKRTDLDLPDGHQTEHNDKNIAFDEDTRLAVIDWLVKMPQLDSK